MRAAFGFIALLSLTACGGGGGGSGGGVGIVPAGETVVPFSTVAARGENQVLDIPAGAVRQGSLVFGADGRVGGHGAAAAVNGSLQTRLDRNKAVEAVRVAVGGRAIVVDTTNDGATSGRLSGDGSFTRFDQFGDNSRSSVVLGNFGAFRLDHQVFGYWNERIGGSGFSGAGAFGSVTPAGEMPVTGTASFFGGTVGAVTFADGNVAEVVSNIGLTADFARGRIELSASMPFEPANGNFFPGLAVTGDLAIAGNRFTGTATAEDGWNGPVDGRFFGPGGSEAGGNLDLRGDGLERYIAGFGARR